MSKSSFSKTISGFIETTAKVIVGCGLMIWGATNFWINVQAYRAAATAEAKWWVTLIMVVLTAIAPFAIGLWWLIRDGSKKNSGPPASRDT